MCNMTHVKKQSNIPTAEKNPFRRDVSCAKANAGSIMKLHDNECTDY